MARILLTRRVLWLLPNGGLKVMSIHSRNMVIIVVGFEKEIPFFSERAVRVVWF